MSATIGRDRVDNLVVADWYPSPIDFDFVVVTNHTTLSRTTIGVIAARASVFLKQLIVKTTVKRLMADPKMSFLGGCGLQGKHRESARKEGAEHEAMHSIPPCGE
jgi:hypothetical protein